MAERIARGWRRRIAPIALRLALFALPPLAVFAIPATAAPALQTIVLTDASADRFLESPVINNRGEVGFLAAGPTGQSVWATSPAGLRRLAAGGDAAPDTGAAFSHFSDLVLPDRGGAAFKATLAGAAVRDGNRDSIWQHDGAALQLVARAGHAAPGTAADLRFTHFETPLAVSDDAQAAFFARVRDKEQSGTADGSGLWVAGAGGLTAAAWADAASDDPAIHFLPQSFEAPFADDPVINSAGRAIFRGFIAGVGVDDANLNGLWRYDHAAGLRLLVRGGDEAVGVADARFVSFPSAPTINAAGDSAFLAFYRTGDGGHGNVPGTTPAAPDLGLWLRRASGDLQPLVLIGDPAPDINGGAQFVDVFNPVMNAASRIVMLAAIAGPGVDDTGELGVWSSARSADGALELVARQGDQAPGCDAGFVFGTFLEPTVNAAGQAAFMASGYRLDNGAIADDGLGMWGQDRNGLLTLIARTGQSIEVAPGDQREIAALMMAAGGGGEDGRPRSLNDHGQLTFRAVFADGSSGVFLSHALTVPEPAALANLLTAAVGVCPAKRRRMAALRRPNQLDRDFAEMSLPERTS